MVDSKRRYNTKSFISLLDVAITVLTFILAFHIRFREYSDASLVEARHYTILLLCVIVIWYALMRIMNLSRIYRIKPYGSIILEYSIVVLTGIFLLAILLFVFKLENISRLFLVLFGAINLPTLVIVNLSIYRIAKYYRQKGRLTKNIMIVADEHAEGLIDAIIENSYWGYQIKLIISDSEYIMDKYILEYTVLPMSSNIDRLIELEVIDEVVYSKQEYNHEEVKRLIYSCDEIGAEFRLKSNFSNLIASKSQLEYFGDFPTIIFRHRTKDYILMQIKGIIDFCFSLFVISMCLPFFVAISIAIKLDSKGPVFFKQVRVGKRNRKFKLYKFRTMVKDAEALKESLMDQNEQEGPVFKIRKDPRITRVGRFLRKTSLDELPQFINVLVGDMAVVGPRPPLPEEVKQYKRWQLRRLSMKPGITCIWQVSDRNETDFENWMKLDMQYIDNWSLKLDFLLVIKTIRTIFKGSGY